MPEEENVSGGSWKIKEDLTCDHSSILGGLSLGIVEISRDGYHGISNSSPKVCLSNFLHFGQDHGTDFFGSEGFSLSFELHLDFGFTSVVDYFKWPVLQVGLDLWVIVFPSDQTFGVEDGVGWIHGYLVFGRISDEAFRIGEGNIAWGGAVTLVVGDDLHFSCGKKYRFTTFRF